MGIVDWFKRGVGEMMVARPDGAKSQIVWKHPDPTIPMKSQLTVEADEQAVFFRDGKVVATLDAGRHTLDSANLPFLSDLVDSVTGGNVFITEVFFVNIREHTGIKFGGQVGHVEDPKSGVPVETMVHGEFSFRVIDPEQLIVGLVGMGRAESYQVRSWMKEQVLKVIRDRIAELLVKNKWPLLDVTSGAYTEEIETHVLSGIAEHVESYGIQVVRLGNFVIAIDEDDADNLKTLYTDAAYLRTVGGVQGYQQFAAGKAMLGAGEGMAQGGGGGGAGGEGGGAGGLLGGAGLGVGFGMAQMLIRDQGGGQTLAPAAAGVVCHACHSSVAPGRFCSACGVELKAPEPAKAAGAYCTSCGSPMTPDAKFCGQCGTRRS
ncbi:MAG: SPFH domain-containing protein [Planctomycetota bacterium]